MACAAATFVGCGNSTPKADLKTDVDTMSYAMGMSQTQGLKEFMVERMGVDTAYMDDFIKGLNDGANAGDDKKKAAYYAGIQIGQQINFTFWAASSFWSSTPRRCPAHWRRCLCWRLSRRPWRAASQA